MNKILITKTMQINTQKTLTSDMNLLRGRSSERGNVVSESEAM